MARTERLVADTHALLWWQAGSDRLSASARAYLAAAERVLVSPVSCWEIALLARKGRIGLDRPTAVWIRDLLALENVAIAELSPGVAVAAAELPDFHDDPADRFLYATARSLRIPLLSQDGALRRYAESERGVAVIW